MPCPAVTLLEFSCLPLLLLNQNCPLLQNCFFKTLKIPFAFLYLCLDCSLVHYGIHQLAKLLWMSTWLTQESRIVWSSQHQQLLPSVLIYLPWVLLSLITALTQIQIWRCLTTAYYTHWLVSLWYLVPRCYLCISIDHLFCGFISFSNLQLRSHSLILLVWDSSPVLKFTIFIHTSGQLKVAQ